MVEQIELKFSGFMLPLGEGFELLQKFAAPSLEENLDVNKDLDKLDAQRVRITYWQSTTI